MRPYMKLMTLILLMHASVCMCGAAVRKAQLEETSALTCRGVMESFAKIDDNLEERLDLYKAHGMTHYFYCPSDDRYCNRWGWKFLYNDSDRQNIRRILTLCREKGIQFVWTLNPGERYAWNEEDYKFLRDKLVMMYYNGIRAFAVDFTSNPGNHRAVRDSLMASLPSGKKETVSVFVIDDIPQVAYPSCGQGTVESLMRGYHFDNTFIAKAEQADALICNLSSNDEFASLAVKAVADCARDPRRYSPDQSMADAVNLLNPDVREAFMTFLRHTGGVQESVGVETFSVEDWTKEKSDLLFAEFDKIEAVPLHIGNSADDTVLSALKPWMEEFGRLGTRGKKVLRCMEYYANGNLGDFWTTYLTTIMSDDEMDSYSRYPVGSDKLHPFCVRSVGQMKEGFSSMLSGTTSMHNLASTLYATPNAALDSDFETRIHTHGHMEFAIPAHANTCHLLTGPLPDDGRILFRQLRTDGSLVAEFIVRSPFTTFDIKDGAVMVDVLGDVEIYETIFVDLQP